MATDGFAVFILTHGRANRVVTYKTLRRQGYTGAIWIIIDNEDDQQAEYCKRFGKQVIVFDKRAEAARLDAGDNFDDRRAVVYARNASFQIARDLGLRYFLQLDDDYDRFLYKFDASLRYKERPVKNLDKLFAILLRYYVGIPALTLAMAQNGDFIGGERGTRALKVGLFRKAMNTFFCAVHRPFQFVGRVNEDVNTYVESGRIGKLFLTTNQVAIMQARTQQKPGGMTGMYMEEGTYRKSFYPILYAPSCVRIALMGYRDRRLHHKVLWNNAVPCIIRDSYGPTHSSD